MPDIVELPPDSTDEFTNLLLQIQPGTSTDDTKAIFGRVSELIKNEGRFLEDGPDVELLLQELSSAHASKPSPELLFLLSFLSHHDNSFLSKYSPILDPLLHLISNESIRADVHVMYFTWIAVLLEKLLNVAKTKNVTSLREKLIRACFAFLLQRTDTVPPADLIDSILTQIQDLEGKGKLSLDWFPAARKFITQLMRTRNLPWRLQQSCYSLVLALLHLTPSFLYTDPTLAHTLVALAGVHLRLQLETLADRQAMPETVHLLEELYGLAEVEEGGFSDETAVALAGSFREIGMAVASYAKNLHINQNAITQEEAEMVASLVSRLMVGGTGEMMGDEHTEAIGEWMMNTSLESGSVLRSLLRCAESLRKVDSRIIKAGVNLIVREYETNGKWREAEELMIKAIEEMDRVDYYDREGLEEGLERLKGIPVEELKEVLEGMRRKWD